MAWMTDEISDVARESARLRADTLRLIELSQIERAKTERLLATGTALQAKAADTAPARSGAGPVELHRRKGISTQRTR